MSGQRTAMDAAAAHDERYKFDWQRIVRGLRIGRTPKLLGFTMSTYSDKYGRNIHPGNDRLALDLDMTTRAVEINAGLLARLGLIVCVRKGGGNSHRRWASEYALAIPDDLAERVGFVLYPNAASGSSSAGLPAALFQHPNGASGSYPPATEPPCPVPEPGFASTRTGVRPIKEGTSKKGSIKDASLTPVAGAAEEGTPAGAAAGGSGSGLAAELTSRCLARATPEPTEESLEQHARRSA